MSPADSRFGQSVHVPSAASRLCWSLPPRRPTAAQLAIACVADETTAAGGRAMNVDPYGNEPISPAVWERREMSTDGWLLPQIPEGET